MSGKKNLEKQAAKEIKDFEKKVKAMEDEEDESSDDDLDMKPDKNLRHDAETGALMADPIEQPTHSASNWRDYLNSKNHYDHPLAYLPGIYTVVGALGAGKSTLVMNLLAEIAAISNPKRLGRILYFSGSGCDELLKTYDSDRVEIFDRRSKESFLTAMTEVLNDATTTPAKKKKLTVIVADDAITDKSILPSTVKSETVLSKIMMSARHVPCAVLITSQKHSALPTFARLNASHSFVFRTKSSAERDSIIKESNFVKDEFERSLDSLTKSNEFIWSQNNARKLVRGFTQGLVR